MKVFGFFAIAGATIAAALPIEAIPSDLMKRQTAQGISATLDGFIQPVFKDLKDLQADLKDSKDPALSLIASSDNPDDQNILAGEVSGLSDTLDLLIHLLDTDLTDKLGINIDSLLKRADDVPAQTLVDDITPLVNDVQVLLNNLDLGFLSIDLGPTLEGLGNTVTQLTTTLGLTKRDDADVLPLVGNLIDDLTRLVQSLLA